MDLGLGDYIKVQMVGNVRKQNHRHRSYNSVDSSKSMKVSEESALGKMKRMIR